MKELKTIPTLGFVDALNAATSKIFQFEGRSRRSEYWWMRLVVVLLNIIVTPIGVILSLFMIPLTFRRLHDTGRSGWWWGACALSQVGVAVLFVCDMMAMTCLPDGELYSIIFGLVFGFFAKYFILVGLVFVPRPFSLCSCALTARLARISMATRRSTWRKSRGLADGVRMYIKTNVYGGI